MEQIKYDVAIVGGGASGLMAAWELIKAGRKVIIIEAKENLGGRAHTLKDPLFDIPVETGAEFIHGNLETTIDLVKKAGLKYKRTGGEIWQRKDQELEEQSDFIEDYKELNKKFDSITKDLSVTDFIKHHLQDTKYAALRQSLINYVEGYYAADANKASTLALKQEWQTSDDVQYRIQGGYQQLINYICDKCIDGGCDIQLNTQVKEIHWTDGSVELKTGDQSVLADRVIITVSLGVLQSNAIGIHPQIHDHMEAARKLGFGSVIKLALQFSEPFWENHEHTQSVNLDQLGFIFSNQPIPTWWTQFPKKSALLTGWVAGPKADKLKDLGDEEILKRSIQVLSPYSK